MKGTFKLICAAVAAIIMIVPLAAFGEEILTCVMQFSKVGFTDFRICQLYNLFCIHSCDIVSHVLNVENFCYMIRVK